MSKFIFVTFVGALFVCTFTWRR